VEVRVVLSHRPPRRCELFLPSKRVVSKLRAVQSDVFSSINVSHNATSVAHLIIFVISTAKINYFRLHNDNNNSNIYNTDVE